MSQYPKKYHGPELKCGGPGVCGDCTHRAKTREKALRKKIQTKVEQDAWKKRLRF